MKGAPDTTQLIKDTYKEIVGIDTIPGTNFAAIFGHLGNYLIAQNISRFLVKGFISLKGGGGGEKYSDPDFHWFVFEEEKKGSNVSDI